MRIALVHDHLCGVGGSERVFQYMCEEFPEADIYTLACNPESTLPYFSTRPINTTWLNRWVKSPDSFRWAFVFGTETMRRLDLSGYDVVLTSSATTAKYITAAPGRHICYCYIPTRALWHFDEYFEKSLKRHAMIPLLKILKRRDYQAAQRVDRFIGISASSSGFINEYYDRDAEVIFCPIDTDRFRPVGSRGDHYLLVSRLEAWKKVDYAIEAFNRLGKPLRVIGSGAEEARLRKMAGPTIEFLGAVDDERLALEYAQCKAVVFTPFIEYGLIPLEANAAGTPVICYGRGGVEETMVPVGRNTGAATAVFFDEQTASALADAVQEFEKCDFDESALVAHAAQWGIDAFKKTMRRVVEQQYEENVLG